MKVSELFETMYGTSLELNRLIQIDDGINFVSRTSKNNGVTAKVKPIDDVKPFDAGLITVALGGSVMSSFVQNKPFYTGYHIMILTPKKKMTFQQKIFYCMCLRANKYRFSYGRQANQTLADLELPDKPPNWVDTNNMLKIENLAKPYSSTPVELRTKKWNWFTYDFLFNIERGHYNKRPSKIGNVNFISASSSNNGVTDKISRNVIEKLYDGNCITVVNNGASTATAFYQKELFTCSHDVNILRIKNRTLNPFIAMFLIPLINLEKSRFSYGRKWRYPRMLKTKIKLPINDKLEPDWHFMENYIKSLSYSSNLTN